MSSIFVNLPASIMRADIGRFGRIAWLIGIIVVVVLVVIDPDHRSVTPIYGNAAAAWWNAQSAYGLGSFFYLPASVLLYSPFWALGSPLGEVCWRLFSVGVLSFAMWRLGGLLAPAKRLELVSLALLLSMPGSMGAIRNGQATVLMLALMILATVYLAERRWVRATIYLSLALALKPIAVPFFMLVAALYWRPMAWYLLLGLAAVLAIPFIHFDPAFVAEDYATGFETIVNAVDSGAGRRSDFVYMLTRFGIELPGQAAWALRTLAAIGTLVVSWLALRRLDPITGAVLVLTFANCYLMLFSPRTESNTYIMLAVLVALFASYMHHYGKHRGMRYSLITICIALGAQGYGTLIFRATQYWLKPLLCIVFVAIILLWTFRREPLRFGPSAIAEPAEPDGAAREASA